MAKQSLILLFGALAISFQAAAQRPAEEFMDTTVSEPAAHDSSSPMDNNQEMSRPAADEVPPAPAADSDNTEEMNNVTDQSENTEAVTTETVTEQTGDVVTMDDDTRIPVAIVDFPARGMSMDKVANELGQPLSKSPAVGNPPITRWDYPDRTVIFEYTHVVHVVAK